MERRQPIRWRDVANRAVQPGLVVVADILANQLDRLFGIARAVWTNAFRLE